MNLIIKKMDFMMHRSLEQLIRTVVFFFFLILGRLLLSSCLSSFLLSSPPPPFFSPSLPPSSSFFWQEPFKVIRPALEYLVKYFNVTWSLPWQDHRDSSWQPWHHICSGSWLTVDLQEELHMRWDTEDILNSAQRCSVPDTSKKWTILPTTSHYLRQGPYSLESHFPSLLLGVAKI